MAPAHPFRTWYNVLTGGNLVSHLCNTSGYTHVGRDASTVSRHIDLCPGRSIGKRKNKSHYPWAVSIQDDSSSGEVKKQAVSLSTRNLAGNSMLYLSPLEQSFSSHGIKRFVLALGLH